MKNIDAILQEAGIEIREQRKKNIAIVDEGKKVKSKADKWVKRGRRSGK